MTLTISESVFAIADSFSGTGSVQSVQPLGNGLVNDTYIVLLSEGAPFVLQKINSGVFPQPMAVLENMQKLIAHLREKQSLYQDRIVAIRRIPALLTTNDQHYVLDNDGECWRAMEYLQHTRCVQTPDSSEMAYALGRALGEFHSLVSDMDIATLHDTLPGFHVTPVYYEQYLRVADDNPAAGDLAGFCRAMIAQREGLVSQLDRMKKRFPLRVIHGDPKLNNFLFSEDGREIISLIDLDTVKPGLVHYDVGDCIRSACNPAGENSRELSEVRFNLEYCQQIIRGYMTSAGDMLSPEEVDAIYIAIATLPFELGIRFFTDYLQGNRYFKVRDVEDNLYKAATQFELLKSIESQQSEIKALLVS